MSPLCTECGDQGSLPERPARGLPRLLSRVPEPLERIKLVSSPRPPCAQAGRLRAVSGSDPEGPLTRWPEGDEGRQLAEEGTCPQF